MSITDMILIQVIILINVIRSCNTVFNALLRCRWNTSSADWTIWKSSCRKFIKNRMREENKKTYKKCWPIIHDNLSERQSWWKGSPRNKLEWVSIRESNGCGWWMVLDRGLLHCRMACIHTEADGFTMLRLKMTSVCLILASTNERALTRSSREE